MYDYTTPFLKSELDYRIDRLRGARSAARRGRGRTGRLRRGGEGTRR